MNENNLNAEVKEEVVRPQNENIGADDTEVSSGEIAEPHNVEAMSDEDFSRYINSVQDGSVEVQDATAQNKPEADEKEINPEAADGKPENADSGRMGEQQSDSRATSPANEAKPFKVFNTQEEYQNVIDGIIGERLKNSRESTEALEKLKQYALNFYETDDGDTALRQLMEDLQEQNADKHGVSVEDYEQQTQDSIDAQKYREEQSRISNEQQRIADIQRKWQEESEELKKIVPEFNFAEAMRNQIFYDGIVNGMSVSSAYLAANRQSMAQPQKQRRAIPQNGSMKGGSAGKAEANPASMSDADFARYIEKIKG